MLSCSGSFLVSLPQVTLASWVTVDSPANPPQTWPLWPVYLCSEGPCVLQRLPLPSTSQAMYATPSCKGSEVLGQGWILEVLLRVSRLKDCLVHSWPFRFHPTLQMGNPRPDREEVCPVVIPQVRGRAEPRLWDPFPQPPCLSVPHLVNRKQKASENISILGMSEKHV